MLTLDTEDLQLQIEPISKLLDEFGGPYLEWIDTRIHITTPGIQAEGKWSVMPCELLRFQEQLKSMCTKLQAGQTAELLSIERNFELRLEMLALGSIVGHLYFQPFPPDGAHVTAGFGLDQSYLAVLIRDIEELQIFSP